MTPEEGEWELVASFDSQAADMLAAFGDLVPQPKRPSALWWLSFCDPTVAATIPEGEQRPGGPSFLGAVITEAYTLEDAITGSHLLGINPGGEVQIVGPLPVEWIGPEWRDRLLTAEEIDSIPKPEGLPE